MHDYVFEIIPEMTQPLAINPAANVVLELRDLGVEKT